MKLFTFSEYSKECFVKVPELTLANTIFLINQLWLLPDAKRYVFDFDNVHAFTPISLLYLSSEINYFRKAKSMARFSVIRYKHASYAAHMGFFRAFGAEFGKEPGEASGGVSYLPITIENANKIRSNAIENMMAVGEYIDRFIAKKMAKVLISNEQSPIFEVLTFCLREITRNVMEHSESKQYAYCAQYWPSKNKASLAILDRGIGIRESLKGNPYLSISTDLDAIKLALEPAISGKMYEGKRVNHNDVWQNSGYGLCMTSEICKIGGSFFIASGESAIDIHQHANFEYQISLSGTLINLDIDTSNLKQLNKLTMEISHRLSNNRKIKPSKASMKSIN
ncbi:MAG: hypothetical protein EOO43_03275 [Flavobacterium sp.]|nr:MAG: hypothetical protein EOO43_03275 [Flavobacterium sp.]